MNGFTINMIDDVGIKEDLWLWIQSENTGLKALKINKIASLHMEMIVFL